MRVISGTAKGRQLKSPPKTTRPIMDRVKENLFNILGTHVIEANVLDLFAGAGSVGIECLSRGATSATFVEFDKEALDTIRANLKITKLEPRAKLVQENVYRFLKKLPKTPFDLIYVAPPQYKEMWIETLKILDARPQWLAEDGILVVQIHPAEYEELELESFVLDDERKYGSTLLCFYLKKAA